MSGQNARGGARGGFWTTRAGAVAALVVLHGAALLILAIEVARPLSEDPHPVERISQLDFLGSFALYGFTSCVLLVLLGLVLRRLVKRPEDYYRTERR